MKDYKQCCSEVAKKHGLGQKLVTGHKAAYFVEAAELFEAELAAAWNKRQGEGQPNQNDEVNDFVRFLSEEYSMEIPDRILTEWNQYYSPNYGRLPIPAPPVVEWVDGFYESEGFFADYKFEVSLNQSLIYEVVVYCAGVQIYSITIGNITSAKLAAENAILRHWAENLNK